jgi:prepilin-type processing-associated H-X9-DG protein
MTYTPPGVESRRAGTPAPAPKTSGLAIASLILGIVGPCTVGLGSIIGIILGIVGLVKIGKSAGAKGGRGLAIAGIVVSGLGILLLPALLGILATILMPAVISAKDTAKSFQSMNNVSQLCKAAQLYAASHGQQLPPADSWPQVLQDEGIIVGDEILADPSDADAGRAYAMNAGLDGKALAPDMGRTVLFFECRPGAPPAGGPDLLPDKPRHAGRYVIGFLDGHVDSVAPEEVRQLIWQPKREPGF